MNKFRYFNIEFEFDIKGSSYISYNAKKTKDYFFIYMKSVDDKSKDLFIITDILRLVYRREYKFFDAFVYRQPFEENKYFTITSATGRGPIKLSYSLLFIEQIFEKDKSRYEKYELLI